MSTTTQHKAGADYTYMGHNYSDKLTLHNPGRDSGTAKKKAFKNPRLMGRVNNNYTVRFLDPSQPYLTPRQRICVNYISRCQ